MNHIENNGIDVFYRVSGIESGMPLIFVHGLAGDSRFFHNQLKFFGESYKTIAIDLPGHGRSLNTSEQSIDLYSRSIETVIETEKIDRYILAGHSMGGVVCIENYLKNKSRVIALILISTSSVLHVSKQLIEASTHNYDLFFNRMIPRIFHKKSRLFIIAANKNITEREKKVITADLKLCSELNYDRHLPEIDIPVLLIANKMDRMIPAHLTEAMKWKIKNSKLVIFNDEGHVPFFENSEKFNLAVKEFIESVQ